MLQDGRTQQAGRSVKQPGSESQYCPKPPATARGAAVSTEGLCRLLESLLALLALAAALVPFIPVSCCCQESSGMEGLGPGGMGGPRIAVLGTSWGCHKLVPPAERWALWAARLVLACWGCGQRGGSGVGPEPQLD